MSDVDWAKVGPELLAALEALMTEYGGTRAVSNDDHRAANARAAIAAAKEDGR